MTDIEMAIVEKAIEKIDMDALTSHGISVATVYQVLNYGNSEYEVNGGINMVTLDPENDSEEYINSNIDIIMRLVVHTVQRT